MTNKDTGAPSASGVHLDDILGNPSEAEPIEESVEEKVQPNVEERLPEKEEEPEKKVLVPHGAFHEERERRKELQKQLAEQQEKSKTLEERQNKILEALATRNAQQEEQYVDPLARLENEVNSVKTQINQNAKQIENDNQSREKETKFFNRYQASVEAFKKDSPDFMDAYNHLIDARRRELSVFIKDPEKLAQALINDEKYIVQSAFDNEENPGQVLYALSKERGYKGKVQEKKIEDIDKGLKASKSLGSGGKVAGSEDSLSSLSAEDLRDMPKEEFDALYEKLKKQSKK